MQVVIARFNEDISWVKELKHPYIIYNKGEDIDYQSVKLDNVGRESETYFRHIINNWDNLADYTVFCQGNPFVHCKDFLNKLVPHETLLADEIYWSDENGCPQHCGLNIGGFKRLLENPKFPLKFGAGAQFIVSKERILSKGWEFWAELYAWHQVNEFPWIMERYWNHLLIELL